MQKLIKEVKKVIIDRTIEMFLDSVVMSAFICLLCITGPMPVGSLQRSFALTALPFIYCKSVFCNYICNGKCHCIYNSGNYSFKHYFKKNLLVDISGNILSGIFEFGNSLNCFNNFMPHHTFYLCFSCTHW